jgi:gluconokinase
MSQEVDKDIKTPLVLALDIGTSSLRAIIFDREGHAIHGLDAHQLYSLRTTTDGGAEIDVPDLLKATITAIDHILQLAGPLATEIAAVGISTFWHSLFAVDAQNTPLTPLYTWADTRSGAAAADLRRQLDERTIHARTGCVFHASYWPAKIRWLAQTQPDIWKQTKRLLSFGEYLLLHLFGDTACSFSMASGTGLLDQNALAWDQLLLDALNLDPQLLPPLRDRDTGFVGLRDEYARRWPALQRVPWYPALGDGACSNIGSGCLTPERLAIMIGTSGAMRAVVPTDHMDIPWGVWCYRVDRWRFLLGGALSEGGNVIAWLMQTLTIADLAAAEAHLQQTQPDGHGLTVLPFLAGERSPGWASHARGAIIGVTLSTQPLDILRASMEAIAYRFGLIHDILATTAPGARDIIASGGGLLHSPPWMQMIADVLNTRLTASTELEASSRGAALLALQTCGALRDLADAPAGTAETYQPDAAHHKIYRAAMARQSRLYEQLIGPAPAAPPIH